MYTCLSAWHLLTNCKISIALEQDDRDKRGETRVKFNWSCIKRVTFSGDVIAEFAHTGCNYYRSAYARLSPFASDYAYVSAAEIISRTFLWKRE